MNPEEEDNEQPSAGETWDHFIDKRMIGHVKVYLKKDARKERRLAVFEGGESFDPDTGRQLGVDDLRERIAETKREWLQDIEKAKKRIARLDAMDRRIIQELEAIDAVRRRPV